VAECQLLTVTVGLQPCTRRCIEGLQAAPLHAVKTDLIRNRISLERRELTGQKRRIMKTKMPRTQAPPGDLRARASTAH